MNKIRLRSETGNVDVIVGNLKQFFAVNSTDRFSSAVIRIDTDDLTDDPKKDNFYPLVLESSNVKIFVSEVRTGSADKRTEAMLECLRIAGFNLKPSTIERIRSKKNLKLTIWKEGLIEQY